jgi:hypothetical protein
MTACNYKHSNEVIIRDFLLKHLFDDPLCVIKIRQRFDAVEEWLDQCLVRGQDWSFDAEKNMFQTGNIIVRIPVSVWFDREEDAVAFKLKFGYEI